MPIAVDLDVSNLELRLLAERKDLLNRIREHMHRSGDPGQISLADNLAEADDSIADLFADTDIAIIGHELSRLRDVDSAMRRIAAGKYGICTECGGAIDPKRLNAQPAARLCLDCKTAFEKRRGIVTHRTI